MLTPSEWTARLTQPLEGFIELGEGTFQLPPGCRVRRALHLRGSRDGTTRLIGSLTIDGAAVRLEALTLEGGTDGVVVERGEALIEDCELRHHARAGLVWAGGTGLARRCVIERNGGDGVLITGPATPLIESCLVLDNAGVGLMFAERTGGEAYGNLCQGNRHGDLVLAATARPTLKHNTAEVERLPAEASLHAAS